MNNTAPLPDLTLEQQFEFRRMKDAVKDMSREQALDLLLQASRLLMIKTNVLRELTSNTPPTPVVY
jgi:hypothetical protein